MWRVRLVLLALLVGLFLAIRYLPGWVWLVILAVALVTPVLVRVVVQWKMRTLLRELDAETPPGMPPFFAFVFKLKGSVLRKARVVVHSVRPVPPPPPDTAAAHDLDHGLSAPGEPLALPSPSASADQGSPPESSAADPGLPPRDYYLLDVTIKPTRWGLGFRRWQPGELLLTAPDTGWMVDDDTCEIVRTEVEHADGFGPEDGLRYGGRQRLRLLVGVRREARRLTFRYYTEKFGLIDLPAGRSLPPP